MSSSDMVKCWFCAEEINSESKKCPKCGEWSKPLKRDLSVIKSPKNKIIEDEKKTRIKITNEVINNLKKDGMKAETINTILPLLDKDFENISVFNQTLKNLNISNKENVLIQKYAIKYGVREKIALVIVSFIGLVLLTTCMKATFNSGYNRAIDSYKNKDSSSSSSNTSSGEYIQKANYFGAYNKSDLDLLIELSVHNDRNAIDQLISTGRVFIIESGKKVSLVEGGGLLSGMMKVRPEGGTSSYWVLHEAVQ